MPLPKVRAVGEDEVFKVLRTGKRKSKFSIFPHNNIFQFYFCLQLLEKSWKRMVTKVTYVGEGFTRKPPKYERFIRPMVRVHPTKISTLTDQHCDINGTSCQQQEQLLPALVLREERSVMICFTSCSPGSTVQAGPCDTPRGWY